MEVNRIHTTGIHTLTIPVVYTTIARVEYLMKYSQSQVDPHEMTLLNCNVPVQQRAEHDRIVDYLNDGGDPEKYTPQTTVFDDWYDVNPLLNRLVLINRKSTNLNIDSIVKGGHYLFKFRYEYIHGKHQTKLMQTLLSFEPVDDTSVEHAAHMAKAWADINKPRIVDMSIRLDK